MSRPRPGGNITKTTVLKIYLRPTGISNARWPPAAESFEGTNCGALPRKLPVSNAQRSNSEQRNNLINSVYSKGLNNTPRYGSNSYIWEWLKGERFDPNHPKCIRIIKLVEVSNIRPLGI